MRRNIDPYKKSPKKQEDTASCELSQQEQETVDKLSSVIHPKLMPTMRSPLNSPERTMDTSQFTDETNNISANQMRQQMPAAGQSVDKTSLNPPHGDNEEDYGEDHPTAKKSRTDPSLKRTGNILRSRQSSGRVSTGPRTDDDTVHVFDNFGKTESSGIVLPISMSEFYNRNAAALSTFRHLFFIDISTIEKMILTGKTLQTEINTAREKGKKIIKFGPIILNINPNTESINRHDLTRARFMACIHKKQHDHFLASEISGNAYDAPVSPLVFKVLYNENNELTPYRYLLGTGFQYQKDSFISQDIRGNEKLTGLVEFLLGGFLLDFLSLKNQEFRTYNPDLEGINNIADYVHDELSKQGQTAKACMRNLGEETFTKFRNSTTGWAQMLMDKAELIEIDWEMSRADKLLQSVVSEIQATIRSKK